MSLSFQGSFQAEIKGAPSHLFSQVAKIYRVTETCKENAAAATETFWSLSPTEDYGREKPI